MQPHKINCDLFGIELYLFTISDIIDYSYSFYHHLWIYFCVDVI